MSKTTYTAKHPTTGEVATRTSEATYTHASFRADGSVGFHANEVLARRSAGRGGWYVPVTKPATEAPKTIRHTGPFVTGTVCGYDIVDNTDGTFFVWMPEGKVTSTDCWDIRSKVMDIVEAR